MAPKLSISHLQRVKKKTRNNDWKTRKLEAALPDCRLVDISVATSAQRMVKSKEEIEVPVINSVITDQYH